jgi:hypothetical protein
MAIFKHPKKKAIFKHQKKKAIFKHQKKKAKKLTRKRHAKNTTSKQIRKEAIRKVRRDNKGKAVKRNKPRKAVKESVSKIRLVSKRKQKPGRKGVISVKRSTKKAGNKKRNVRPIRKAKKSKSFASRKRPTKKEQQVFANLIIHENYKKDKDGNTTSELNDFLTIEFDKNTTFAEKIFIIQNHQLDAINIMIDRHRLLPRSYMIILRTENPNPNEGNTPYERANKISDPTVNPEITTIRQSILELIIGFQDNYFEYVFDSSEPLDSDWVYNPENISAVIIRFFYAE